jgi:hypothetical protein
MLVLLVWAMYKARHWNELRWHDISTNFHDDQFKHISNIKVNTTTISEVVMLVLLIEGTYSWDAFVWHDIHARIKFHEEY